MCQESLPVVHAMYTIHDRTELSTPNDISFYHEQDRQYSHLLSMQTRRITPMNEFVT